MPANESGLYGGWFARLDGLYIPGLEHIGQDTVKPEAANLEISEREQEGIRRLNAHLGGFLRSVETDVKEQDAPTMVVQARQSAALQDENVNAIRFADTIKLIQAADTKRPVILALGTGWIKGYKRGEPQYGELNRLISAIRNYCSRRGVTFICAEEGDLLGRISAERARSQGAKVIVVAGKDSIAPEGAVLSPLRGDKDAFLAAVDSSALDETCYVRLAEMLRIALELGLGGILRDSADPANPNIAIKALEGCVNVVILLPRAERVPAYENLRRLYRVQVFA
jgi:hypothetical protein